jgi:hypothetical protein
LNIGIESSQGLNVRVESEGKVILLIQFLALQTQYTNILRVLQKQTAFQNNGKTLLLSNVGIKQEKLI